MGQRLCDRLIEVWGEGGSLLCSQWDLVGPRQGGASENRARNVEEQHFDVIPVEEQQRAGDLKCSSTSKMGQKVVQHDLQELTDTRPSACLAFRR